MLRAVGVLVICLVALTVRAQNASTKSSADSEHTKWLANVLESISSVKVGSTRSELAKIFTTDGGIYTPPQRTYVLRQCPYIKVDVRFAPSQPGQERPADKIVEISRPYLQWPVED